jgi:hypothetical protein
MSVITLRETNPTENGFNAILILNNKEYSVKIRYFYQRGYGLNDLAKYQGEKGFLFFEMDIMGKANPVEASENETELYKKMSKL